MKHFHKGENPALKRLLYFLIAVSVSCFLLSALWLIKPSVRAEIVGVELPSYFTIGTEMEVPEGRIEIEGDYYDASHTLYLRNTLLI